MPALALTKLASEVEQSTFLNHPLVFLSVVALAGSVAPLAPWPALVSALVWTMVRLDLLLYRRCQTPRLLLEATVLAVLFVLCAVRATGALREYTTAYFEMRQTLTGPARCAGAALVTKSPTSRQSMRDDSLVTIWSGRTTRLDCEGVVFDEPVDVRLYGGPANLSRGDHVEFIAQLGQKRLFRNAALPTPWPAAASRKALLSGSTLFTQRLTHGSGLSWWIDRARARVRTRILATYSKLSAPLGRALVLGENDLDEHDAEAFRNSGLLHLLAVSGTHLVLAVLALVQALGAILVRVEPLARRYDVRRLSSLVGAVLSLLYADFSGGSGSAWRAAFMLCVVCGGRGLGHKWSGSAALGASLLVGLAVDPLSGCDYSFLLSALATSGLIGLGQPLARWLERGVLGHPLLRPITLSFVATICSTLPCAPILAAMDGDMTLAALFANVVAGPMGELVALPACLLHAVVSRLPALERGLALLGSGALHWVRAVALWSADFEAARFPVPLPGPWHVAWLVTAVRIAPLAWTHRTRLLGVGLCGLSLLTTAVSLADDSTRGQSTPGTLAVTALDVGQGDALLIELPSGEVGLMDGGGFVLGVPETGERVVLPALRARGIDRLSVVVVSHAHPDHILGLLSVARKVPIAELWVPRLPRKKSSKLNELVDLVRAAGGKVAKAAELCGVQKRGGVRIEVLSPCGPAAERMGLNDASLVLRLVHGQRAALLTGDIEQEAEAHLVKLHGERLGSDLLKVAHHGSDTSSTVAFVDAVAPRVAFISCGVRNRFRHPRPSTMKTLGSRGIFTLRTDRLGSLSWRTDGQETWTSASDSAIVKAWHPGPHPN